MLKTAAIEASIVIRVVVALVVLDCSASIVLLRTENRLTPWISAARRSRGVLIRA